MSGIHTREATVTFICPFSNEQILPGARITQYTMEQHTAYVQSIQSRLPDHLINHILTTGTGVSNKIGMWGLDKHTNWLAKKSGSGRTIKPVLTQAERSFRKGSGFVGCDTYDRGYDRGEFKERGHGDSMKLNVDLAGFIVDDDRLDYDHSLQPDEEFRNMKLDSKEWESDEEESDEGEWSGDGMDTEDESDFEEEEEEEDQPVKCDPPHNSPNTEDEDEGIGCNKCYACVSGGSHPCLGPEDEDEDEDEDDEYCHGCESGCDCPSAHTDACNRQAGFLC